MEYNCQYCEKICKNNNSLKNHESRCPKNLNRVYKNGMLGKKHSIETKLKISTNNGMKKMSDDERKKRSELTSKRNKLYFSDVENRKKYSIKACSRLIKHSKYSKNHEYSGAILESSYELLFAKQLDEKNIKWEKCRFIRFPYIDEKGIERGYIPDFFLPQKNLYIDTKNDYLIKKDQDKISRVREMNPNIHLMVFSLDDIVLEKIDEV